MRQKKQKNHCFRLTIRNVNVNAIVESILNMHGFRLTIRNVNNDNNVMLTEIDIAF